MPPALLRTFIGLAGTFVLSMGVFLHVMYDNSYSGKNLIEAGSFAAQTVTGVGYGNWEKPAITPLVPIDKLETRVLQMRGYSIFFMLLGATFYVGFTSVAITLLVQSVN